MDNFDLKKYLAEGRLLKENVDFPELEDEFEGAMDAMIVEPEVYLQDIIDAPAEEIVSDDYYEIMNAVEQGVYSKDEAVKLAKAWAKEKLSSLAEGRLLKEDLYPTLKKISNKPFTIVYQISDMTDYTAYDELLSDREQDLIQDNNNDIFIFDNNTPANEIDDNIQPDDAEEGNNKLERYGLSKYWKY